MSEELQLRRWSKQANNFGNWKNYLGSMPDDQQTARDCGKQLHVVTLRRSRKKADKQKEERNEQMSEGQGAKTRAGRPKPIDEL